MDNAPDDELRELRARAYGPTADIAQDYKAIQRLQELEARRTTIESGSVVTSVSMSNAATSIELPISDDRLPDQPDVELSLETSIPQERVAVVHGVAERTRRRRKMLWIASVVTSSALAAIVTYAMTAISPVSASSGAPQVATLNPSAAVAVPAGWLGADETSSVFDFYGFTLFTAESDLYPEPYSGCLIVVRTDQVPAEEGFDPSEWSFSGEQYSGCGVGAFPAVAEVPFGDNVPDELSLRFPSGRALQFLLDGDRVGVFLDSE